MLARVTSPNPLREGLPDERRVEPCVLVIFGASGDLTRRTLLPAVYNLGLSRLLPSSFAVVGVARRQMDDEEFATEMRDAVAKHSRRQPVDEAAWIDLAQGMRWVAGTFEDEATYAALATELARLDRERGTRGGRVFYLAVAPSEFPVIVRNLARHGLVDASDPSRPWPRVVVEKPFGTDLASAERLNRELLSYVQERQVFRIDHYLGKETVQNLLVLRFGNTIFEPLWNRTNVHHVEITVAEHIGVEGRGRFYEQTGILRDIVQNHALQLLCLVAMEPPIAWDADAVRDEKVKVLRGIAPIRGAEVQRDVVRGQYVEGLVRGDKVHGYRAEPDVAAESMVETYLAMRMHVESWRWSGVPFYLRAGKRLAKRITEIAVHFRPLPLPLFRDAPGASEAPNALIMRIQPDEGIALRFATKVPGGSVAIREVSMDFRYGAAFGSSTPEAYERLLLDAMRGDATLFTRHDEVEAQWRLVDPILAAWSRPGFPLAMYPAGSWGPVEGDQLLARDGVAWRRP
jgi:glucose-6-phosphate 1-dehydrogenase